MTLEEQIAKRLRDVANAAAQPERKPIGPFGLASRRAVMENAMTREVIRLMEWSRHRATEHVIGARGDAPRWAYETLTAIAEEPLSLPPDDWKP